MIRTWYADGVYHITHENRHYIRRDYLPAKELIEQLMKEMGQ